MRHGSPRSPTTFPKGPQRRTLPTTCCLSLSGPPRSAPSTSSPTGPGSPSASSPDSWAYRPRGPPRPSFHWRVSASRPASPRRAAGWPSPTGDSPLLARRDRTSVGLAKKRWSIALEDLEGPFEWRNVTGRRGRQLLRNIEHTDAVHGFLAALTAQAPLLGWEIVQLDPPRRASRHFRHDDRMRAVNPDAFGVLRKSGTEWAFFLEWERRAVRPSTMSDRLAPYLRYYSSHRPLDDHGTRPAVLVVFDDDIAATHFLRVAREEMRAERVTVPLWVSHKEALDALGPLGRAWRTPGEWESPQVLPPPLRQDDPTEA